MNPVCIIENLPRAVRPAQAKASSLQSEDSKSINASDNSSGHTRPSLYTDKAPQTYANKASETTGKKPDFEQIDQKSNRIPLKNTKTKSSALNFAQMLAVAQNCALNAQSCHSEQQILSDSENQKQQTSLTESENQIVAPNTNAQSSQQKQPATELQGEQNPLIKAGRQTKNQSLKMTESQNKNSEGHKIILNLLTKQKAGLQQNPDSSNVAKAVNKQEANSSQASASTTSMQETTAKQNQPSKQPETSDNPKAAALQAQDNPSNKPGKTAAKNTPDNNNPRQESAKSSNTSTQTKIEEYEKFSTHKNNTPADADGYKSNTQTKSSQQSTAEKLNNTQPRSVRNESKNSQSSFSRENLLQSQAHSSQDAQTVNPARQSVKSQMDSNVTDVARQIQESITSTLHQGRSRITVRLNPPELGKINISFQQNGQEITGLVEAARPETKYQIDRAVYEIMQNLEEAGIQLAKIEVTESQRNQTNQQDSRQQPLFSEDGENSSDQQASQRQNHWHTNPEKAGYDSNRAFSGEAEHDVTFRSGPVLSDSGVDLLV